MDGILHPIIVVFAWIWVYLHKALTLIGIPDGPGIGWVLAIVLMTVLVRFAIVPLYLKQTRSMRSMQMLQPEMQKIQAKYKGKKDSVSRQRMSEETMALYKKHGASPYASCWPMLVQMPVLFGLYRVIFAVQQIKDGNYQYDNLGPLNQAVATDINNSTVFGVGLSQSLGTTPEWSGKIVFILLIVVLVVVQFLTMRLSMKRNMAPNSDANNPMVRSQKSMMYLMPLMFVFTGVVFQMGLLMYMVTTTTFGFFQQLWVNSTMPTPGSPAFNHLLAKRESAYQKWAAPEFRDYDEQLAAFDGDEAQIEELQSTTLATVERRARAQRVNNDFPEDWGVADRINVYRQLAREPWKTLPDAIWMKQMIMNRRSAEAAATARKSRPKKLSKGQRQRVAERARLEEEAMNRRAARNAKNSKSGGTNLSAEEIEKRRQQRRQARRQQGKSGSKS